MKTPRVAFFTDSFHEVNGVARTSREFVRFAKDHEYPLFSVHPGSGGSFNEGNIETYEIANSEWVIRLEVDLFLDPLFLRHRRKLLDALRRFQPDLIHVTGPGHTGILGAVLAQQLEVPLAASWHTNVHEFAGRRLQRLLLPLPKEVSRPICRLAEQGTLAIILEFYKRAQLLFAPNPELIRILADATHRPTHLMLRGVNTDLFSPSYRDRRDHKFVIGYVGRLSSEKNVRFLVALEQELIKAGFSDYSLQVVGEGREREYLASRLQRRELTGVLRGHDLSRAYANMDVFVFPSETDTFGNVILEAMASGVPGLVSLGGGPKYIVRSGVDGFEVPNAATCADQILRLYRNPDQHREMSHNARERASAFSWDAVFSGIYQQYSEAFAARLAAARGKSLTLGQQSPIETLS